MADRSEERPSRRERRDDPRDDDLSRDDRRESRRARARADAGDDAADARDDHPARDRDGDLSRSRGLDPRDAARDAASDRPSRRALVSPAGGEARKPAAAPAPGSGPDVPPPPPRSAPRGAVVLGTFLAGVALFLGGAAFEHFFGTRLFGEERKPPLPTGFEAKDRISQAVILGVEEARGSVVAVVSSAESGDRGKSQVDLFPFRSPDRVEDPRRHLGSGVVWMADGSQALVATSHHAVARGTDLKVIGTVDGRPREFPADLMGSDELTDLALLRVSGVQGVLRPATWGDSSGLMVGEAVLALSNPFGVAPTALFGNVAALAPRALRTPFAEFAQISVPVGTAGNGGPVVNLRGEVVGIATTLGGLAAGQAGISFVIPANFARQTLETLRKLGRVPHAYLGVTFTPVADERLHDLGLEGFAAAYVADVARQSPANEGGVTRGDIVTEIDGKRFRSLEELESHLQAAGPRQVITLGVQRHRERLSFSVTLRDWSPGR